MHPFRDPGFPYGRSRPRRARSSLVAIVACLLAACSDGTTAPEHRSDEDAAVRQVSTEAGEFRSTNAKCMDVAWRGRDAGTQLILRDCHGGANQRWWRLRSM